MEFQAPYELKVVDIDVETDSDGSSEINVRYEGRHGAGAVRQKLPSQEFAVLLACCQALARRIFDQEFRLNSEVEIEFELTQEDGITIWHTHPSTYLKMPLIMNMHWSCHHLKKSFNSHTTLGVLELPPDFKLVNGALPTKKALHLIMDSMASGIEFMGMLILQREQIDHEKEKAAAEAV